MTPSKRAGDTVDESIDEHQVSANGDRNGNGDDSGSNGARVNGRRATPRRRSVVAAGSTTALPERGTASQRGVSSSIITKRASERFPEDAAGATLSDPPAEPAQHAVAPGSVIPGAPSVEQESLAPPVAMAPPAARVDPDARRPATGTDPAVMPLPVTVPAAEPLEHEATSLMLPDDVPPEAPYVTSTMTSHDVAPVPRVLGRRPRVRRVTRVVRHVDPWSVFKVAIVFNLVLYGVLLTAGVLLWNVAYATGTIDNLERFFESFGWEQFEFDGGAIYHASWIAGLFGVVGLTGAVVLAATLFNLITDLVGGVRMTVLEEEVVERTAAPMRRFVVRRPTTGTDPSAGLRREVDRFPVRPDDEPSEPA